MIKLPLNKFFDFNGKVVVITGGSMGIGFGITKRFAEAGATVIMADVNPIGKKSAEKLKNEFEIKAHFFKTDVSSEKDIVKLMKAVEKTYKKIDVFVNNAGIYPFKPALETDLALWEKVQAINLRGTFLGSREAAKLMIKKGTSGSIINIASVDAVHPSSVGLAAYDASKHGVWGFTKNFALETAPHNIRVNCIAPGGIRTEGVEKMTQGATKAAENPEAPDFAPLDVPMKRMGEPDEIAMATLFLKIGRAHV